MTPEVTDFIPGSLEDTDKFIEVTDGHHVTAKQKGSVLIQMFDDNGETFFKVYASMARISLIQNPIGQTSGKTKIMAIVRN